jgi:hypothetical protein
MGGTRALLASLGASISLVAGAALSLLVVSFVFAYDGLGGTTEPATTQAALLVDGPTTTTAAQRAAARRSSAAPLVIKASAPKPVAATRPAAQPGRRQTVASQTRQLRSVAPAPPAIDPKAPAAGTTSSGGGGAGDGVRDLGDSVSSTVQDTGKGVGAVVEPLGPPVTQAVQKVLDLLGNLLKDTTGALGAALDKTLGK